VSIDKRPVIQRFTEKTRRLDNGCIEWLASKDHNGYGKFAPGGGRSMRGAHRWAYEFHVGPIPAGLVLDHLCRNRACVNPDHLEPVTQRTNVQRGAGNVSKTHCPRGHAYAGDNLRIYRGMRYCRECIALHNAARSGAGVTL
jgi:hypothetical protein